MAIRFVALDLGNVLVDLSVPAFPEALARATSSTAEAVRAVFDEAAWHSMEVGDAHPSVFRGAILKALNATLHDDAFDACWNLVPTARAGADELVARLKVPYAIWSNTDPIHARHMAASLRCMETAVHLNLSHLTRARKPDRAFYERGLAALGAKPEEVLFVDDRADNRAGAAALGIHVEEVLTLAQLEAALNKYGLL